MNSKTLATMKFTELGSQIRHMVEERQKLYIRKEKITKDIFALQRECEDLQKLSEGQSSTLAFLDSESEWEWDPLKMKERITIFQTILDDNGFRFKRKPVGPLYSRISVKSEQWWQLTERVLSPELFTYIADNPWDKSIMEELVTHFKVTINFSDDLIDPFPVKVTVFNFDIKYESPQPNRLLEKMNFCCTTLLGALKFDNVLEADIWKNLIGRDLNGDITFLFQTEHDAFIFMHAQANRNNGNRPPVVALAYSLDGYKIFPYPGFKTAAYKIPKNADFVGIYRGDDIECLQLAQAELEESLRHTDREILDLREQQFAALEVYENCDENNNNLIKMMNYASTISDWTDSDMSSDHADDEADDQDEDPSSPTEININIRMDIFDSDTNVTAL